jgi:adenylate cyclase class IV
MVSGLGKFVELETVLKKVSLVAGRKEHKKIYAALKLREHKAIAESYSDLVK